MGLSLPGAMVRRIHESMSEIVELRHRLHKDPETKFEEYRTMSAIRDFLAGSRIELMDPLIGTDTVGLLRGGKSGPTVLLRADMDALPLQDASGKPWRSANAGKSHACGHDGHVAMLLAAARLLEESADDLAGNVRFVFQPAEEETGGGKALVAKGLLELQPAADVAFALHGWSGLELGKISCAPGAAMAGSYNFTARIRGKGGHGGQPHRTADPIVAAAQAILSLQTIVSRNVDPLRPAVVSVCNISGGDTKNVIPEEAAFEGTVRCVDKGLQEMIRRRMRSILDGTCEAAGCTHTLDFAEGYIPMVNAGDAVAAARSIVAGALGPDEWTDEQPPSMAAEDFAFYLDRVPGCLLRLGLGSDWFPLHSPEFDFNDEAMEAGIAVLVALAMNYGEARRVLALSAPAR